MTSATEKPMSDGLVSDNSKMPNSKKSGSSTKGQSQKKIKPETKSQAKSTLKIDLEMWLQQAITGRPADILLKEITKLPKDFQGLAGELLKALSTFDSKPSSKFKIEKLPIASILKASSKIRNSYYLAFLTTLDNISIENRKIFVNQFLSSEYLEEKIDYLLNRASNLKNKQTKLDIWEQILVSPRMQGEDWKTAQLKILDWGFSQGLKPHESRDAFASWHAASVDFKLLETPAKNRIYRKILDLDPIVFWNFLIHIARDSVSEKFLGAILGQKSYEVILAYFNGRPFTQGIWSAQFESKYVSPLLKTTVDEIMDIEKLLMFLPHYRLLSHLLPTETLPRAIKRCYNKGDELAQLLGDSRVGTLEIALEEVTQEAKNLLDEKSRLLANSKDLESRIRDFEVAITNYENKLRIQMTTESSGNSAVIHQGRVELMRTLLEGIDHILNSDAGIQLERSLQKFGVSKLGEINAPYAWNDQSCESLTGAALETGIVIRCGYTWVDGDKKTLIRRVLLK